MAEHEPCIGKSSDWFTPKFIFDAFGLAFDLDPAHPGRDNPYCVVPTRQIFTARDDGLRQPWHGLIWLNPPFGGRRGQVAWLRKFFQHGNGIALIAARTSADWFREVVVPNAELLCFPAGKTKFIRPDGSVGREPGTGIVLIGMGRVACEALLRSGLGACYVPEPSLADRRAAEDERAIERAENRLITNHQERDEAYLFDEAYAARDRSAGGR